MTRCPSSLQFCISINYRSRRRALYIKFTRQVFVRDPFGLGVPSGWSNMARRRTMSLDRPPTIRLYTDGPATVRWLGAQWMRERGDA